VPADATAFAHRDAKLMISLITAYQDAADGDVHIAWTEAFFERLRPIARGVYANFLADEGRERVHEAYPAATYSRLAAIKRAYDPSNLFRRNQNIRPHG
jgi:FAD/FMN-containing dehydrogenase